MADFNLNRLKEMGLGTPQPLHSLTPEKVRFAYLTEAFKAGATGYLLKRSAGSELLQAIQSVMNGHNYITPLIAKSLVQSMVTGRKPSLTTGQPLTPRQREVLQLVAEGNTVKEIAAALDISPKTVEFHKTQLMEQLDLHTTAELTRYALAHGLISCSTSITPLRVFPPIEPGFSPAGPREMPSTSPVHRLVQCGRNAADRFRTIAYPHGTEAHHATDTYPDGR